MNRVILTSTEKLIHTCYLWIVIYDSNPTSIGDKDFKLKEGRALETCGDVMPPRFPGDDTLLVDVRETAAVMVATSRRRAKTADGFFSSPVV